MGAGLITSVGYIWPGHTVDLVPVDRVDLRKVRAQYELTPPVPTLDRLATSELLDNFPTQSFDFITADSAFSWSNDVDDVLCGFEVGMRLLKDKGGMFVNDGPWGSIFFNVSHGQVRVKDRKQPGSIFFDVSHGQVRVKDRKQ